MPDSPPEVRLLELFEGPVELLLYLVRKAELDVFDVPVARLTDDYLAFLRRAEALDMEAATDFMVMAAVLLRLKTRRLLPRSPDENLDTPAVTLEGILDDFRRYQHVAGLLAGREAERRLMYPRRGETPRSALADSGDMVLLAAAFKRVLSRLQPEKPATVEPRRIRVEDHIEALRRLTRERGTIAFDEAVTGSTLAEVIVMFIAVLELIRLGELSVRQEQEFGTIQLVCRDLTGGSSVP
ncbi:MAG: segregation/condensation protein A [candidate division WOR-3 bacterium]